jgi:hypothetical protein
MKTKIPMAHKSNHMGVQKRDYIRLVMILMPYDIVLECQA